MDTSASAKSTPKAAAKPATKPLAKAFAQPDKPAKTEAAPKKAAKPTKADAKPAKPAKPAKVRKPKLVRDRFTVTADDYAALVALKQRAAKLAVPARKNALLRAGIRLLTALSDTGFKAELGQLPPLKPPAEKKAGKD
jgi:outer membrane biosynthesis protein TonB